MGLGLGVWGLLGLAIPVLITPALPVRRRLALLAHIAHSSPSVEPSGSGMPALPSSRRLAEFRVARHTTCRHPEEQALYR